MKIERLEIRNFRAIENVLIEANSPMVVIAGPNGCGKSCVLDAIRLVKSIYGGYADNEFGLWLGEFQIEPNSPSSMKKVLRDKNREALIRITLSLHPLEKNYLLNEADELGERTAVQNILPNVPHEQWRRRIQASGQQGQQIVQLIENYGKQLATSLKEQLSSSNFVGELTIHSNGRTSLSASIVLQSSWGIYEPTHIGIVDYHGPQRHFSRENVGNVNLNLKTKDQSERQSALYNYAAKYANIKTQMATEFVLYALQQQGGSTNSTTNRELLSDTLKELFLKFFPGKEFQGVTANADGELEFEVTAKGSGTHDINELSSGEKEILFGYLRLRNNAQRNSIILLDEPELHLNPKLIQGLPQFYEQHVAMELNNQIWTVTHSDTFLREAISSGGPKVYHMTEADTQSAERNQIVEISGRQEEDRAVLEIIGDIAGYRPGGKIVVFEGEGSEFDKKMTATLFPTHDRKMNFVSGGNKSTVRRMHELLEAQSTGKRTTFSIVDKDDDTRIDLDEERGMYTWDVYHIENYLLESSVILTVLKRISLDGTTFERDEDVEAALRGIAGEQVESMVEDWVRRLAHKKIGEAIKLKGGEADGLLAATKVGRNVSESAKRISDLAENELSANTLAAIADDRRTLLNTAIGAANNDWKKVFRGRDILKQFVHLYARRTGYETVRDMIVKEMAEAVTKPPGMLQVLSAIDGA